MRQAGENLIVDTAARGRLASRLRSAEEGRGRMLESNAKLVGFTVLLRRRRWFCQKSLQGPTGLATIRSSLVVMSHALAGDDHGPLRF